MTRIIPVIRHADDETSIRNAVLAEKAGAAGVFLIHMSGYDDELDCPARAIKAICPKLLVGTNRLSMLPAKAIDLDDSLGLDMTWADNCGVTSAGTNGFVPRIVSALDRIRAGGREHLFFGSVAFKYQAHEPDPATAALKVAELGWIATTSGSGTGSAPSIEKLAAMKSAIGNRPLAVASGITPDNAIDLLPFIDYVLVATGIERDHHNLDPHKLDRLMDVAARFA